MKPRDKKLLLLGGVAIVILLLLVFRRAANSTVVTQGGNVSLGDVSIPAVQFSERKPFSIPGFGNPADRLSAIGACCSDCASTRPVTAYRPAVAGPTIVFNEGQKGNNVYNFAPPPTYTVSTYGKIWTGTGYSR